MKEAIKLAKKGLGWVNPNPMVGAVIVKDKKIIGRGYHKKYGYPHAEREALASCTQDPEGATMYVSLEPCCHYGKTAPCTEAIINSKIKRLVIASSDPNPLASGKGIEILRKEGIEVVEGVLKEECDKVNEVFFHYIKTKTPYLVMKYAMTIDGKIASRTGKSKWISGSESRANVHLDRHKYSAIMVGVNTVIKDDPMLNCRIEEIENHIDIDDLKHQLKNPVRIICDSKLRTPLNSRIINTAKDNETIIATCEEDNKKLERYIEKKCKIVKVKKMDERIDLKDLMKKLGELKIDSVFLEGGSTLNWSALESNIVNKVQVYIAPKLFGGENAKSPISGLGIDSPSQAFRMRKKTVKFLGEDVLIEGEVE
ncbi:MAG: bifunctional diaminohydroxyphosphoribosylaminopyrimidine deaminase/5-amino-6-(5-phosphoribosylamino)uracil reductase RibD [Peptostreptococcus sp.]